MLLNCQWLTPFATWWEFRVIKQKIRILVLPCTNHAGKMVLDVVDLDQIWVYPYNSKDIFYYRQISVSILTYTMQLNSF